MWASADRIVGLLYGARFAETGNATRMLLVGAVVAGLSQLILVVLVLNRGQLRTEVVARHVDATPAKDMAFMKLPVVWWCFGFFLLSTMTLAVVQNFAVPILKTFQNQRESTGGELKRDESTKEI